MTKPLVHIVSLYQGRSGNKSNYIGFFFKSDFILNKGEVYICQATLSQRGHFLGYREDITAIFKFQYLKKSI